MQAARRNEAKGHPNTAAMEPPEMTTFDKREEGFEKKYALDEEQKFKAEARRTIYEMAARECDLLREVLAKDCRMESVTSNIGRQFGQQPEGYTVNGAMNFQITLK